MGRFTFKSLPQGISNAASLWNILTDANAIIDADLNLIRNMDDRILHARKKVLQFAASNNLSLLW